MTRRKKIVVAVGAVGVFSAVAVICALTVRCVAINVRTFPPGKDANRLAYVTMWASFKMQRELLSNPLNPNPMRYETIATLEMGWWIWKKQIDIFLPIGEYRVDDEYRTGAIPFTLSIAQIGIPSD